MNPQEAVECARQLQTRKAVSIHWGTFALSEEPMEEPPEKLQQVLQLPENQGIVDFVTVPIGGSVTVPSIVDAATTKGDDSSEPLDDPEDDKDDDDIEVRSVG
jgi:N-acyl-phosphatidylethanolamine-hydrolysing phospholipase D